MESNVTTIITSGKIDAARILSMREVATLLECSVSKVFLLTKNKQLTPIKRRPYLYDLADIQRYAGAWQVGKTIHKVRKEQVL
jgi:hypothetical protein